MVIKGAAAPRRVSWTSTTHWAKALLDVFTAASTKFFRYSGLVLLIYHAAAQEKPRWISIDQIHDGSILYSTYTQEIQSRVDVSDLVIPPEYQDRGDPLNTIFREVPDFKLLLLEKGIAELRDQAKAPESYKKAQERAQSQHLGIWQKRLGPLERGSPTPNGDLSPTATPTPETGGTTWQYPSLLTTLYVLGSLGSLGLTAVFVAWMQRRNPRLLILGEKSSGKSSVLLRLFNPTATPAQLQGIEPSRVKDIKNAREFFPWGNLKIYPIFVDPPGPEYGEAFDELLRLLHKIPWLRPRAILYVLAPTGQRVKTSSVDVIDNEYLIEQFGLMKGQLEAVLKSRKIKKPKVLILFLNKFDLFSKHAPNDPECSAIPQFERLFQRHTENIRASASSKILLKIVIGSAIRNWGFADIQQAITGTYGKQK